MPVNISRILRDVFIAERLRAGAETKRELTAAELLGHIRRVEDLWRRRRTSS